MVLGGTKWPGLGGLVCQRVRKLGLADEVNLWILALGTQSCVVLPPVGEVDVSSWCCVKLMACKGWWMNGRQCDGG